MLRFFNYRLNDTRVQSTDHLAWTHIPDHVILGHDLVEGGVTGSTLEACIHSCERELDRCYSIDFYAPCGVCYINVNTSNVTTAAAALSYRADFQFYTRCEKRITNGDYLYRWLSARLR